MSVAQFIRALGGVVSAAERFGVSRTTPYSWLARGLPARFHVRAIRIAAELGIDFDPEAPPDASVQAASADDRSPTTVRADAA